MDLVDLQGQQLGNYHIIRLLGTGSMADVYLAKHTHLPNPVAIKVLRKQLSDDDLKTFRAEARLIGYLEHPHILRVLEFGVENSTPILIMEYAPKGTLRQRHPRGVIVPLSTVVHYVKQLATALQYAHNKQLLHCNIKPENLLLGYNSEVLLSDFLITAMAQKASAENLQKIIETTAYMAPEQVHGKPCEASDQYALAVVIYEWLTGTRPFNGTDREIMTQKESISSLPLHEKTPTISPTVEQVLLTALQKEPYERYANILEFASALEQAYQIEQQAAAAVTSMPSENLPTLNSQLRTWRTYLPSRRTVILGLAGLVVAGGITWEIMKQNSLASSHPRLHLPAPILLGPPTLIYRGHRDVLRAVAWSPDGRHIASGGDDAIVEVWGAFAGKQVLFYDGHREGIFTIAWSPNSQYIASGGDTAQVWNASTGDSVFIYEGHANNPFPYNFITAVVWSPGGKRVASGSWDQTVQVWDAFTGKHVITYRGHTYYVNCVAWSPNGKYIASGSGDTSVQIWDSATGEHLLTYHRHTDMVYGVQWSPDGTHIVSGDARGKVLVWNATTANTIITYSGHVDQVTAVAWSPDGTRIASGSYDKTVQVWNATTGDNVHIYRGHSDRVQAIAWSPDSQFIASASSDMTVQVWRAD